MVQISKSTYEAILSRLEKGDDRTDILDYIYEQGFTILEAKTIYAKVKEAHENNKMPALKKIEREIPKYSVAIWSVIIGAGITGAWLSIINMEFSWIWGIPWMVYVFGKWFFCLFTGNLPAMFAEEQGFMVASCRVVGANYDISHIIFALGGLLFSLVIGSLLVFYMVWLARKYYHDNESTQGVKRSKYFIACINGAIGFSCLTAVTYALFTRAEGEIMLDITAAANIMDIDWWHLLDGILVFVIVVWIITLVITGIYFWKNNRLVKM